MSTPSDQSSSDPNRNHGPDDGHQHELLVPSAGSSPSPASDSLSPHTPAKKRRVQWVGLSEDRRSSVQSVSNLDPFISPPPDPDCLTPIQTPTHTTPGLTTFLIPVHHPTTGILSRRSDLVLPQLSLSMPDSDITQRINPYFPPLPSTSDLNTPTPRTTSANTSHHQHPSDPFQSTTTNNTTTTTTNPPSSDHRRNRRRSELMATPDSSRPASPDSDLDIVSFFFPFPTPPPPFLFSYIILFNSCLLINYIVSNQFSSSKSSLPHPPPPFFLAFKNNRQSHSSHQVIFFIHSFFLDHIYMSFKVFNFYNECVDKCDVFVFL